MKISKAWAMPNRWTFSIPPIKELIERYCHDEQDWIDPFCGESTYAICRNDLNPDVEGFINIDALEFLTLQKDLYDGAFYDPPYSMRQASECYKKFGKENLTATVTSMKYWADVKNVMGTLIKPNGLVICCGWNSNGLGNNRGFEMIEILLVAHGGSRNDTIVTVERKL